MENNMRHLPSVDKILGDEKIKSLESSFPHHLIVDLVRENLEFYRSLILKSSAPVPSFEEILNNVSNQAHSLLSPSLRVLINATGVILHTNLGRAPLSAETITAMSDISRGYNNLEFDLKSGERGSRHTHVESLLSRLTGAEAGLVVNNNASAVLLGLSALARRKEIIVSRGQAVEIGGGFRIPEVMKQSGAKLIEVGTTNCTYIQDYEQAITPQTAALLRVHSSNFKVVGFTSMVSLEEIVTLGKKYNLPVLDDLGSGCPIDTAQFGLEPEPTIQESILKGADLAFFSGDKLLGGPQAGIIIGKKILIDKLKKHPLVRAIRIDKTRLAGLATTLLHYLKDEAISKIPVWRMISLPVSELDRRAKLWSNALPEITRVIDSESVIGGGSMPGAILPTRVLALGNPKKPGMAKALAQNLRLDEVPIVGRISEDFLLLDPRTVDPKDDEKVIQSLKKALSGH
jgi:L-seryl-tRNA(Ser) seleniumtransferase